MGDHGDDPTAEPELAEFRSEVRAFANRLPEILAGADSSIDRTRRFLAARYDAGVVYCGRDGAELVPVH